MSGEVVEEHIGDKLQTCCTTVQAEEGGVGTQTENTTAK